MYSLVLTEVPNYYIDNYGNVYRWIANRFRKLKAYKNKEGYLFYQLGLGKKGKAKGCSQHRLLAQAFIPNPENKPTVDHINKVKDDNRLENLRWAPHKEQRANSDAGRKKGTKNNPYLHCKRIFPHILKPITS